MLATDIEVRLSFTDTAGNALSSVQVGQEFLLTATVQDITSDALGVASAYFDLDYDEDLASLSGTTVFHSDDYSIVADDTNILAEGSLTSVGGAAESSDSLSFPSDPLTLFTIHLVATATGELEFTVSESTLSDAFQRFTSDSTSTVSFDSVQFVGADYESEISITVVDAGPAVTSFVRYVEEETAANFLVKDFTQNFLDLVEGESDLLYVKITELPTSGALTLDGSDVTENQVIAVADLDGLLYTPASGAEAGDSDGFSWTGSANGTDYAADAAVVTIVVMDSDFNVPPTLSSITATTTSGATLAFTGEEFDNAVIDLDLGDALDTVTITALPENGTLYLDGEEVDADDVIDFDDLDGLTYVSTVSYTGSDSFSWNASDGEDSSLTDSVVTLTITESDNDAPTLASSTKTDDEDTTLSFTASDFTDNFSDADGDSLQTVKITVLPVNGTLYLNGTAVTANQEIDADDLDGLTYEPDADYYGTDSFTWNGSDGITYAAAAATVTITVNAVSEVPTVTGVSKTTTEDTEMLFTESDFTDSFSDADGDELQTVEITQLPYDGTLYLNDVAVTVGQEIDADDLENLTYQPDADFTGTDTFMWNASDGSSYAEADAAVTITVSAVNDEPAVADSTEAVDDDAETYYFSSDTFSAHFSDPDGDSLESVEILTLPSHGTLYLDGVEVDQYDVIDADDLDELTYVLEDDATGLDSFTWTGSDGTSYADSGAVMSLAYESDVPTLTNSTATIATNATLAFDAADFTDNFSDAGVSGLLYTVKIVELPAYGTLYLNGEEVTVGQEIAKEDLANLSYVSDADFTGNVTLVWNGSNGKAYAEEDATITITCVADVPTVSDLSLNVAEDTTHAFSADEFTACFSDYNPAHALESVKITALPENGTLYLDGEEVEAGDVIDVDDLDELTYVPDDGYTGTDTFTWTGSDGTTYAEDEATITITVAEDVPVVSDSTMTVGSEATLTFSASDFTDYFEDYDQSHSLEKVKITALPADGTLYLDGDEVEEGDVIDIGDIEDGLLTYVSDADYAGDDTFSWVGSDGTTYADTEATVTITVLENVPTVSDFTATTASGATLAFSILDFTDAFSDTDSSASLQTVKITALPTNGTLYLDGTAVTLNQEIAAIDLWKLTYVADADYTGTDTITWTASDGTSYAAEEATITITVEEDVPTVSDFTKTVAAETTLTFSIADFADNFSDPNSAHSLQTIKITELPDNGTLYLLGEEVDENQVISYADLANLTYVGDEGITGTDSFSWVASDGTTYAEDEATVTITLADDEPVASDFGVTVAINTTYTFSVEDFTSSFTDYCESHSLQTVKFTALPENGTLYYNGIKVTTSQVFAVADLANLTYEPDEDFAGTDTISWTACDGYTYSDAATITVTVASDVPEVSDFEKTVALSESSSKTVELSFSAADFTSHFTDYDASHSLESITITALPNHGTLYLDGTEVEEGDEIDADDLDDLTYQADVGFVGTDSFTWTASDGETDSEEATVTISVTANVPTVSDFTKTVLVGSGTVYFTEEEFAAAFTDPAGDSLKIVEITELPIHGTLYLNGEEVTVGQQINADDLDDLCYVADDDEVACSDAFKWVGIGSPYSSNDSTVTIVTEEDVPTVNSFTETILVGATYTFTLEDFEKNFSDPDSDAILETVKIVSLPEHGTLYLDGEEVEAGDEIDAADIENGLLTYTSTADEPATDTFRWNASNGASYAESDALVVVNAEEDIPVVSDFSKSVDENGTLTFSADDFTDHFTDLNEDHSLQKVKITELPSHGTLYLDGEEVEEGDIIDVDDLDDLTYEPDEDYTGTDSFDWTACDDDGTYAETDATVTITVGAVDDAPTVDDFSKSVDEDGTLEFSADDFTDNFSDPDDADLATVKITALPSHGTLYLDGEEVAEDQEIDVDDLGELTYEPDANYSGTDSFTWTGSNGTDYAEDEATVTITVNEVDDGTGSLSGSVYLDADNDGVRDAAEIGLPGVAIQLLLEDSDGEWTVVATTLTDASGRYTFEDLAAGTYKLVEVTQPTNYVDGVETAGSLGGTVDSDSIYDIVLDDGEDGTGYRFGEKALSAAAVSKRLFLLSAGSGSEIVASLNKAPTVDLNGSSSGTGSSASFDLGDDAVKIASSATITDADGGYLASMTVTITNLQDGDSEELAATTDDTDITASYSDGVLTLTGVASLADYQTVLRSITYENTASDPTAGDRAITVVVSDGIAATGASTAVTATVTVTGESDDDDDDSTTPEAEVTTDAPTITADDADESTTTITITYTDDGEIDTDTFDVSNIEVDNDATVTAFTYEETDDGYEVTYTITAGEDTWADSTQGTYTISLVAEVADTDGNTVEADDSFTTFVVDTSVPTASVSTAAPTVTVDDEDDSTTTIVISYIDDGEGLDTDSFATTNIEVDNDATVTGVSYEETDDGYDVTYTITAGEDTWGESTQGTYTISLVEDEVKDLAGNYVEADDELATFTVDTVAPTVTVEQADDQDDPTTDTTVYFTVVFSEEVDDFDEDDVNLDDSTAEGDFDVTVTDSGDGTTYTVAVTISDVESAGTIVVAIEAGAAEDENGNANEASASDDNSVQFNTSDLTVTINQADTQEDPTYDSTIHFTVVFSQSVSDFATGDVTLTSSAGDTLVGTITGSGTTYDVAVTGMTQTGTITAYVAAGVATDEDGNANSTSTSDDDTVTYDITGPTVTINQASGQSDPTADDAIYFTVEFSEVVSDFTADDVTLSGTAEGTLAATVTDSGDGMTYTVAVTGMTGSGTVIATIASDVAEDATGNANSASTSTDNVVTYDVTSPTVTIDQASTQEDPTNGTTIYFTVVFTEEVSDFTADDVTLVSSAGDTLTAAVSGSGATYTVAVTGMTSSGTVTASIAAGVATDEAGNVNEASTSTDNVVTYDVAGPTVTIEQASGQDDPTNNSTIHFTVVFSEEVSDFATGDVTIEGTAAGDLVATVTGSGATYDVAVTGMTGSGTVVVSIAAGVAEDAAGNASEASTSDDNVVTYDVASPTVAIDQASTQDDPTSGDTIYFTVVFSEEVSGFDETDVTLVSSVGDTLSATVADSGDGMTYTVAVTGMATSGTVTATIIAGVAADAAGNVSEASTSTDNVVTYEATVTTLGAASVEESASVVQSGTEVVVTGTTGADTIVFVATADQYTLTVNGVTYAFSTSDVNSFRIDGNGGDDAVELTGDDSDQTAVLYPTSATFQGEGFSVEVTNAKSIQITAGSGDSEAYLYDSVGDDTLEAEGLLASLSGDDFVETVLNFNRVTASAANGGTDTASVAALDFVLSQEGSWL